MEQNAKNPRTKRVLAILAAAACVAVAALAVLPLLKPTPVGASGAIAEASYPPMEKCPERADYADEIAYTDAYFRWLQNRTVQQELPSDFRGGEFFQRSCAEFLTGAANENRVYSPVNVYMALSMLAEVTDGNSRAQLLSLLGADSLDALHEQAGALWNASYCDDGALTSVLANSFWLSGDIRYNAETAERLAQYYYASSFSGEMGSAEYNALLQDWLNKQTGGLLSEQVKGVEMTPDTVLALASTVYFKAGWLEKFDAAATASDIFHTPAGDVTADFMHKTTANGAVYTGEGCTAVREAMEGGCAMWLILPDADTTADALLESGAALDMALSSEPQTRRATVNLAMPKFDVCSDLDLIEGLQTLGVTEVFDAGTADFSPLTQEARALAVTKAEHAARVTVDEEGCTAAAYTVILAEKMAMPAREIVDFTLDRPFVFVITGAASQPLFVGVVNQP